MEEAIVDPYVLNKRYGQVQRFIKVGGNNYYISKGGIVFYITDENFYYRNNNYKSLVRFAVEVKDYHNKSTYVEINNVKYDIKKLVALYFLKGYEFGDEVIFKDNDYHNCRYDNLKIVKHKRKRELNGI